MERRRAGSAGIRSVPPRCPRCGRSHRDRRRAGRSASPPSRGCRRAREPNDERQPSTTGPKVSDRTKCSRMVSPTCRSSCSAKHEARGRFVATRVRARASPSRIFHFSMVRPSRVPRPRRGTGRRAHATAVAQAPGEEEAHVHARRRRDLRQLLDVVEVDRADEAEAVLARDQHVARRCSRRGGPGRHARCAGLRRRARSRPLRRSLRPACQRDPGHPPLPVLRPQACEHRVHRGHAAARNASCSRQGRAGRSWFAASTGRRPCSRRPRNRLISLSGPGRNVMRPSSSTRLSWSSGISMPSITSTPV